MVRNIVVRQSSVLPMERRPFEICEHKGIGHPDTMTDGICEAASRALSRAYLDAWGRILHHNLDKGLLLAGRSAPRFGGGLILKPMRFIICGRAVPLAGKGEDVPRIVREAARHYLKSSIGYEAAPDAITAEISETSGSLMRLFAERDGQPPANDTSFGTGHAPYSRLERAMLNFATVLKSPEFRREFPAAGSDYKIMGCRLNGVVTLTVALAFVDRHVEGAGHYFGIKRAMGEYLTATLDSPATIRINMLDDPHATGEEDLHLTVTGLSGEMGDDGQVGRGNRVNGLITPGRAMSLEAAAGKNPVSHVGKLYNVLATLMARDIQERIEGIEEVGVQLLSAIGQPIDQPQLAGIEISTGDGLNASISERAREIADVWLADPTRITQSILDGQVRLF